jgi:hypothetical protein
MHKTGPPTRESSSSERCELGSSSLYTTAIRETSEELQRYWSAEQLPAAVVQLRLYRVI